MTVPRLEIRLHRRKHLDEAHTCFHQAAGHQAPSSIACRYRIIETVKAASDLALVLKAENVLGSQLHSRGKLIIADSSLKPGIVHIVTAMLFIHPSDESDLLLLHA